MAVEYPAIPDGFGVPLVDLATDLLPAPTMSALDARYEAAGAAYATDADLAVERARIDALAANGATDAELAIERARVDALEAAAAGYATDAELAALAAAGATDAELAVERARIDALEAAPAPPAPKFAVPLAGIWMSNAHRSSGNAFSPWAAGTALAPARIRIEQEITIDRLGFYIGTGEAVQVQALLYGPTAEGMPGALVASASVASGVTSGTTSAVIPDTVLEPGDYWGLVRSNAGSTIRFRGCVPAAENHFGNTMPPATPSSGGSGIQLEVGAFGAPANPAPAITYNFTPAANDVPVFFIRRKP